MNWSTGGRCLAVSVLCGTCLVPGLAVLSAFAAPAEVAVKPAETLSIKGTCNFKGKESEWSAVLTAKGDGSYDAVYTSSWGGSPGQYTGSMKTDLKTEISGEGKASGGRANGRFEFSGKYGTNAIAQCTYQEVGGGRQGSMTAEMPK